MWKLNWTELGIDWDRLKDVLTYDSTQPMIFNSGLFLFLFLRIQSGLSSLAEEDHGTPAVCHFVFVLLLL